MIINLICNAFYISANPNLLHDKTGEWIDKNKKKHGDHENKNKK